MSIYDYREATKTERILLHRCGYFPWGFGAWIHKDRLGGVLTTDQALERVGV